MIVRCRLCGRILAYHVAYYSRPWLCYSGCRPPWRPSQTPGTGEQVQTTRRIGKTK